jgi:hypothetical protein
MLPISTLPSRRHAGARSGLSAKVPYRQSVIASNKKLLVQDFSSFKGEQWKEWKRASEDVAKKLWNKPPGAGAQPLKTTTGVKEGRLELSSRGMKVNMKKGALLSIKCCTMKASNRTFAPIAVAASR